MPQTNVLLSLAKRCSELALGKASSDAPLAARLNKAAARIEENLNGPFLNSKDEEEASALIAMTDATGLAGRLDAFMRVFDVGEKYQFEIAKGDSKRTTADADTAFRVLCRRLSIESSDAWLKGHGKQLLLQYCTDFPVNIAWYDAHAKEQKDKAGYQRRLIIWMGFGLLIATLAPPVAMLFTKNDAGTMQISVSLIGLLVGGALTALKLLATGFDAQAKEGVFWNASSDLKEALFRFEARWAGKLADPVEQPLFLADLQCELEKARAIATTEQRAFFAIYKSPSDLLTAVSGSVDAAKTSRQDLLNAETDAAKARGAAEDARQKALLDARQKVIDTTLDVNEKESLLEKQKADPALKDAAVKTEADLVVLRAALEKAKARVALLLTPQSAGS